jgi:hypothetical protein
VSSANAGGKTGEEAGVSEIELLGGDGEGGAGGETLAAAGAGWEAELEESENR